VDSIDEPEAIDPPEDLEQAPDSNDQLPFDEGFIPFQDDNIIPVVFVEVVGSEDATANDPITGSAAFNGPNSENLVFQLADAPSNGDVTFNPDGTFSFVPDADYNGSDSFTYKVFKGSQLLADGRVVLKVLPVNDAPTSTDTALSVTEDGIVSGSVDASDIDGDKLTFEETVSPANGVLALLPNGDFTYTPDLNFEGTDSFQVAATDPDGESTLATVTITVDSENDAPIITTDFEENLGVLDEGAENNIVTGQLQAIDPDVADSVTWSGTSQAKYGTFTLQADGAWSYTLDNTIADKLAEGENVVEVFSAVAEDENGASTPQNIEVTITGTNDAPILKALTFFETVQDVALSASLTAVDLDGDPADLIFALSDTNPPSGAVLVAADGSFTYTPAAEFSGFDTFEYTVTDKDGGVSTGVAKIAVQSDPDSADNQTVSVTFNEEAQPDVAANTIELAVQTTEVTPVNLAFALDRSGSIGSFQWAQIISAVQSAVTDLAVIYEGSDTSVDVQIITYATNVRTTDIYDLQDPDLLTTIASLVDDYRGGATAWNLALQEAADFFFDEPASEPNFLLFLSDGEPTNGAWVVPYAQLTDPTDQYDVTISAFGFGQTYNDAGLLELDPDAVFLNDPSQLANAFSATPIFNPDLISFEVTLEAETQEQIVIADENSEGFVVKGTDFELPLASIENIQALLGETNVIGITALFDVDGDPGTAEISLFSTEVIGKSDSAETLNGFPQADLLFGSDMSDTISGGGGDDIIFGFEGDDTLSGGSGADIVRAGGGNDVIIVSEDPELGDEIDGGLGRDVLRIEALGEIDALLATLDIEGIEAIDLDNGQSNSLTLSFDEIIELSDTSDADLENLLDQALPNARTIYGDTTDDTVKDQLVLDGEGTYTVNKTQTVTDDAGNSIDIYTFNLPNGNALATLGIDTDIEVTTDNVVA
jgi:VCBS repeat-containing protein